MTLKSLQIRPPLKRAGLCLVLLIGGAAAAHARLGESFEELVKRFGTPLENKELREVRMRQLTFRNKDLLIGVTLVDGKSASEQYARLGADGKVAAVPPELAGKILEANTGGAKWEESGRDAESKRFLRSDKEAMAVYMMKGDVILEVRFSSSTFNRHIAQLKPPGGS